MDYVIIHSNEVNTELFVTYPAQQWLDEDPSHTMEALVIKDIPEDHISHIVPVNSLPQEINLRQAWEHDQINGTVIINWDKAQALSLLEDPK